MTQDRERQAEELCQSALELDPAERPGYLLAACGSDSSLHRAVESLLARAKEAKRSADATSTDPLLGRTISHYEVSHGLGRGGMGAVYKARDLRLQRLVALKFLHPNLLDSEGARQRFLREGQALSSLSHPHIATVYEVDEADGTPFLALEYLPGGTLRERVHTEAGAGRFLALRLVIEWGTAIAEGLAHAHRRGIVHRDVKSSNIMFDAEGRPKLTDFGLAQILGNADLSAPGTVAGTFTYMAPEQASGKIPDRRSDLYSLGVVLFEAATGRLPLEGGSPAEMIQQLMSVDPPAPSRLRKDLPLAFDSIVARLLDKAPGSRYQRGEEVSNQLQRLRSTLAGDSDASTITLAPPFPSMSTRRRWIAAAGVATVGAGVIATGNFGPLREWLGKRSGPQRKQVAVLSFRNIGGDANQQAFVDGLTETLASALTRQPELSVVAPTDSRKLETAAQARREFGVNLVISGSVQRRGDTVRLVIGLIDAQTQRQIDVQEIQWPISQLSRLEDGVLTKVADLLSVAISQKQRNVLANLASPIASAHDAYLRGRGFLYRHDMAESLQLAQAAFEEAIRRDPNFAAAYVGLAETLRRSYRRRQDSDLLQSARKAASQAIALNSQFAAGHVSLGAVLIEAKQPTEAERELETALRLDPLDPATYRELATLYQMQRRFAQVEQVLQRAVAVRPGDWISQNELGVFYRSQQRYADAEMSYRRVVELSPDNHIGYRNLGVTLFDLGHNREAETMFRKSLALRPAASVYNNLGALLVYEKHYSEAVPIMEKAAELAPTELATSYRLWGNLGDAYWLANQNPQKARAAWLRASETVERQLTGDAADAERLSLLANYRAKAGAGREAIRSIESAIAYAPESALVRYQAGLTYALLGQKERALPELRLAIAHGYSLKQIRAAPELEPLRTDPRYELLFKQSRGR